ncbi:hypothetical protein HOY80DRAFT_619858 [Tuber brumale]|nr:hypothetical protein HOY80DRAFT_619858 [Tuber brumale]
MSTSQHNFYGPTPWMIQEPLCTEAIVSSPPGNMPITAISQLLCNDLNFVPARVAARATRFGQWTLEKYTMDPFDREERFQRTQTLPDPRGLDPTGWLTSDIMDAVTTRYNQFHPDAEIFSVSLTALLAVTGDGSQLEQSRLGARFWIFIQSNGTFLVTTAFEMLAILASSSRSWHLFLNHPESRILLDQHQRWHSRQTRRWMYRNNRTDMIAAFTP